MKKRKKKKKQGGERDGTLSDQAYETIKRGILQGEFEEGTFLSAPEVMHRYGISRTPFREACNRLHHERILEVVPRRGYLIPEISFRTVRDLFEVRLVLEVIIAELAATRATPPQLDELTRLAEESWSLSQSGDTNEQFVKANTEFHLCLARMTQNRELLSLAAGILERNERVSYMELRSSWFQPKEIQNLHGSIVAAIRRRDPAAARTAVIDDIQRGKTEIFGSEEVESVPRLGLEKFDRRLEKPDPAGTL
jgi:DNA-binding GntR family transcriptional regulator